MSTQGKMEKVFRFYQGFKQGVAGEGSEEGLEEWREEGAALVGSEEGVVSAEWRERCYSRV